MAVAIVPVPVQRPVQVVNWTIDMRFKMNLVSENGKKLLHGSEIIDLDPDTTISDSYYLSKIQRNLRKKFIILIL
jgi:hypothetical protein